MARPHDLDTVNEPAPAEEMEEMAASLRAAVDENPDPNREPDEEPPAPREKPAAKPAAKTTGSEEGLEDEDDPAPNKVVDKPPAKPAAKPAEKPPEAKKPDEKPAEEPELTVEQIRALKPGRGASKDDVIGFRRLREIAEKATTAATAAKNRVKELEGNADTAPALATKVKEQEDKIAELQKYEFLVNPESSHLIRSKYDPQITQTEDQILHYLREGGMKEATVKSIKDEGKLRKFSKDQWLGAKEWNELKPFAKKKAQDLVVKYFDLQDERATEIEKAATDRTAYEGTLKEKTEAQVKKNLEEYEDEVAKMLPELPGWARIVPEDGLKGEELSKAKEHNKYLNEVLEPMFQKAANPQSVREVARNAAKIVELHQLKIEHEEVKARLAESEAANEALEAKIAQRKSLARIPGGPAVGRGAKPPGNLGSSGAPAGDEDDMKANMDLAMGRRQQ